MLHVVLRFIMRHRRSLSELTLIVAGLLVAGYVCFTVDVFETEGTATRAQETIELDEVIILGAGLSLAMLAFSWRRVAEVRREVARRAESERAFRTLASEDPLTGLANRRKFNEQLEMALGAPPSAGAIHALLMLDLNGFKKINDVHGHGTGDELLSIIGERLKRSSREGDLVARLGGDEFAVLSDHLPGPEAAANIAMRVLDVVTQPISIEGVVHEVGVGIGIATFPFPAASRQEVVRRADIALYRAKAEPASAMRFFDDAMDRLVHEREHMERELRKAISRGTIQPHFQPLIDIETHTVTGFQAVPAWEHKELGTIPPERFLPIAEEAGLLPTLSDHLFRAACQAAATWPSNLILDFSISASQLRDRTLGLRILSILSDTRLLPQRVEIALSESALVRDLEAAQEVLGSLRKAGVHIALDQFGTGYSSLYHLRNFQFDKIKIDRSFVAGMGSEKGSGDIVSALVGLGRGLGLTITAEGVDDREQMRALREKGCQEAQGHLFGTALSAEDALRLVQHASHPAGAAGAARSPL